MNASVAKERKENWIKGEVIKEWKWELTCKSLQIKQPTLKSKSNSPVNYLGS